MTSKPIERPSYHSRQVVLDAIRATGQRGTTRAELAEAIGMGPGVNARVRELLDLGMVEVVGYVHYLSTRGRPKGRVELLATTTNQTLDAIIDDAIRQRVAAMPNRNSPGVGKSVPEDHVVVFYGPEYGEGYCTAPRSGLLRALGVTPITDEGTDG